MIRYKVYNIRFFDHCPLKEDEHIEEAYYFENDPNKEFYLDQISRIFKELTGFDRSRVMTMMICEVK